MLVKQVSEKIGEHNIKSKLKGYEVNQIKHALSSGVKPKDLAKRVWGY